MDTDANDRENEENGDETEARPTWRDWRNVDESRA